MACARRCATLLLAGAATLSGGCGGVTEPSQIQGVDWKLASFERRDGRVAASHDPNVFTVRFDPGGELRVRADCNLCSGGYELRGVVLSVSPLACTRAFCATTAPLDTEFTTALQRNSSLELRNDVLTLRSSEGTLRFIR